MPPFPFSYDDQSSALTPTSAQPLGWGDTIQSGLGMLGKLFQPPKEEGGTDFEKALEDLKRQSADFYARLGKMGQAPEFSSTTPSADSYLSGARTIESGGDDNAVNPLTGASGRYQFLPSTARELIAENPELGLDMKRLNDPETQEKLMKLYTNKSVKTLEPMLGRKPTAGELYLLHLLGHSGGSSVIRNQDAPIADTIPSNARDANKTLLGTNKTGRQLLADLNKRFGG